MTARSRGGTAAHREVPRPFLKWAGGKGQLLDELRKYAALAAPFHRYHEPFVGGGALFFGLFRHGALEPCIPFLSDNNGNLIEAYLGVRDHLDDVLLLLKHHQAHHDKDYYYAQRGAAPTTLPERAARLIYLNRTCFNGLYRENSRGEFNVPIGDYQNPVICDETTLRAASQALKKAVIETRSFATVLQKAKPGDFVYFDPPYHPVSKTSSFTKYAKGDFGEADQRELADVFAKLTRRGVKALLSNSHTEFVCDLYKDFTVVTVYAVRAVNSRTDRRGKIAEALIRNF